MISVKDGTKYYMSGCDAQMSFSVCAEILSEVLFLAGRHPKPNLFASRSVGLPERDARFCNLGNSDFSKAFDPRLLRESSHSLLEALGLSLTFPFGGIQSRGL